MNTETFDIHVETQLAPTLQKGDVVILDNLSSHKSAKAEASLKERGTWFLFLPPCSPDLNPTEMAFAKPALSEAERLKAHLRRIGARTFDALWRPSATSAPSTPNRHDSTSSKTPDMRPIKRSTLWFGRRLRLMSCDL